jgi:hypothetical protein
MQRALAGLFCLLMVGCATPEFRAAKSDCAPDAYARYPVVNVNTIVTRYHPIQVPSGQTHCTTTRVGNTAHTTCIPLMRTDFFPYPQAAVVDTNEAARDSAMNACAAQLCLQRYGNAECKP